MNYKKIATWILGFSIKMLVIVAAVSVLYFVCGKAFDYGADIFAESGMAEPGEGKDILVNIPVGSTNKEVAKILYDEGLIRNESAFPIQMFMYEGKINAGTYSFNSENSPEMLIEKISNGVTVEQELTEER